MKSHKLLFASVLILISLLFSVKRVYATLVFINKQGELIVKVLSSEDTLELSIPRRDYLAVKEITQDTSDPEAQINLYKKDGKIELNISGKTGDESLDITNYQDEVIELEERAEIEKVTIELENDKFLIKQRSVVASTDYEININPKTAGISLKTPTGLKYLSILPRQAAETVLKSKLINKIDIKTRIPLNEEGGRELAYEVKGEKVINLLNIFNYSVPVSAKISAANGEVLQVQQPTWLKVFGFLFV